MNSEIVADVIGAIAAIAASFVAVWPQIRKANERIDNLFYYTMSGPMYENLRKLAQSHFMTYEMSEGLKRELYYLRDTGFITITDESQHSIKQIPFKGDNLQQYVTVTDVGRRFVEMRTRLDVKQG